MAIADPKIIYPKLEKDGVQKVKEKLAMGVYARYKIPLIQEWLNNQNLTAHPQFFIKEPENYHPESKRKTRHGSLCETKRT